MKKLFLALIVFFGLLFAVTTAYSIVLLAEAKNDFIHERNIFSKPAETAAFHLAAVLPDSEEPFFSVLKRALAEEGRQREAVVELMEYHAEDSTEALQALEMAVLARVDGIILHPPDKSELAGIVNRAEDTGIPVITVEKDLPASRRSCFIGTNSYQLGYEAGKLVDQISGGHADIGIVLGGMDADDPLGGKNFTFQGFTAAIRTNPLLSIETVESSRAGMFSSEEITQDILKTHPGVDAIFCTSARDTIGTAQVLVDLNRVGEIAIIGFDDTPEIRSYIEKGVVQAAVIRNPATIGSTAVRTMLRIIGGEPASDFIDTGVSVLTSSEDGA